MRGKKRLTVVIPNAELDALEDLVYCELSDADEAKARRLSARLWNRLVKECDKPKARRSR